jgi:type IV secretory pathway VirD2 relaxase
MTKDNPFERRDVFHPRIGRRAEPRQERMPTTFLGQLLRAVKRHGVGSMGASRAHHGSGRRGTITVRPPNARSRRCVIKARYMKVTPGRYKGAKVHLAYLEREGVERDGSAGKLYGADEGFDAQTFRIPIKDEQRQFRFIVAPEDGERLDLKEFARGFMRQVEKDTGRSLIWTAVNHYNTDNPHVHIVVRGVDREGHDVRIDGRYIGQEMRWRAQEVLTRELGPRSDLEMDRQRAVYVGREALTPIDRLLAHYQSADGKVMLERLATAQPTERAACLGRLSTLERLGLATREGPAQWHLSTGWQRELDKLGEWAEMANRVYRAIPSSAGQYEHVEPGRVIPRFEGVVRAIGLHDEQSGKLYAVVEVPKSYPRYVQVPPDVAQTIRVGDKVSIGSAPDQWVKPSDERIVRFAQGHHGVYDPATHQRALEESRRRAPAGGPTPAELVAANVRRLERLERYGLAERQANGRWRVPPDLIAKLEAREQSHPRHALRVEIQRPVPERAVDVGANDRRSTGEQLAKQIRMNYVDSPERLTGRVVVCPPNAAGREYVQVVDAVHGRFTLVPKPPGAAELVGRVVTVAMDRDRKLSIQIERSMGR